MAKELAGVTVLEGGSVKWATVAGIFLGVPAYTITHGFSRTLQAFYAAAEWLLLGPFSFAEQVLNLAFSDAELGLARAATSFGRAAADFGVYAPLLAAFGTALIAYVFYLGVTAIGS